MEFLTTLFDDLLCTDSIYNNRVSDLTLDKTRTGTIKMPVISWTARVQDQNGEEMSIFLGVSLSTGSAWLSNGYNRIGTTVLLSYTLNS